MAIANLKEYLNSQGVKYQSIVHPRTVTTPETAETTRISGKELAKTVILKLDGALAMAVLPASYQVELESVRRLTGVREAELATESEFKRHFPDCETGAMPPFGNLYGIPVYVDESLTEDHEIAFNAGSHYELIRMAYLDFERLVGPEVMSFSSAREAAVLV